jgi:hypothetical protein
MKSLLTVVLIVAFTSTANAGATISDEFAICGGVYEAASKFLKKKGGDRTVAYYHGLSRGARVSAAFMAFSDGRAPDFKTALQWAQDVLESNEGYCSNLLETKAGQDIYRKKFDRCLTLVKTQSRLLTMMRENGFIIKE